MSRPASAIAIIAARRHHHLALLPSSRVVSIALPALWPLSRVRSTRRGSPPTSRSCERKRLSASTSACECRGRAEASRLQAPPATARSQQETSCVACVSSARAKKHVKNGSRWRSHGGLGSLSHLIRPRNEITPSGAPASLNYTVANFMGHLTLTCLSAGSKPSDRRLARHGLPQGSSDLISRHKTERAERKGAKVS